ncbi:MAG: O-antigen ligase family protein [Candidatus Saccharibacteria bacterium]|nr:O-antigen ligase family protein [Candidatus Saccharibacteria bacterium]
MKFTVKKAIRNYNLILNLKSADKLALSQILLLLLLPLVLFFSAFPVLNLTALAPEITSLNLELSLPEFWLIFFSIVSLSRLLSPAHLRAYFYDFFLAIPKKSFLISLLFPAYASLSLLWTKNFLRGFLTVTILWLLWFSILNIVTLLKSSPHLRPLLKKSLMLSTVFICLFCWLQCFANVFWRKNFLLCLGCTYSAFGFPHPNGFTLEPQFMGNLLLAPALLSLKSLSGIRGRRLSIFIISTLFLTFSRGTIFSFIFALPAFILTSKKSKSLLKIPRVIITSFLISLLAQGFFAQFSPVNTTFYDGIRASISQLSLNKINLPSLNSSQAILPEDDSPKTLSEISEQKISADLHDNIGNPSSSIDSENAESVSANHPSDSPNFDGYVPESTNIRLRLSELALDRWNDDPFSLIFGAGAGSAGASLFEKFPSELGTPKEIVQNEYVSLLLELGVIPYCIIFFLIVKFRKALRKKSQKLPLILAYAFSLLFFSGLPNALHIYLLPFLL